MRGGTLVRSLTDRTSTPSAARWSRVPSVAKISTSSDSRSRASAVIPSRFATESRARTRASSRSLEDDPRWRRQAGRAGAAGHLTIGRRRCRPEYSVRPWHTRAPPNRDEECSPVTLAPWEYLFQPFNTQSFHDIFWPIVAASIFWLVALIVLYNIRTG